MSVESWTFLIVLLTFALYIAIGWWARVRESSGFYVAGQGVPAIANGAATAADWMSAASFLSMAGLISFLGYDGSMYLIGWTGGYVLLALLLAPYLRKFGKYTVPDFVGDRYYSNTARVIAAVAAIFVSLTYVVGQMSGVGIVMSRFLGVSMEVGVLIGTVIVGFFAMLGGMKGITWTQVAQYIILIVAFVIPVVAISQQLTGIPIPQISLITSDIIPRLNTLQTDLGFQEYTQPFVNKSKIDVLFITLALMCGTAGLPHVIVRFYTVPNVRAARYSAFWALLFIAVLYTSAPALAIFARYNIVESLHGKTPVEIAALGWPEKWQKTGLLQFEDKNGNGIIELTSDKATTEFVKFSNDIVVLATPEIAQLSPWVVALVAAGGLAAALSTAAGLLLVLSSSIAHDIYFRMINPNATEKKRVAVGRVMVLVAVVAAGYFGMRPPAFVGEVVAFAFGLAAASFFPIILLGIFSSRTTSQGAIAGMLVGLSFTMYYIIGVQFYGMSAWCFGISAQGIGTVGMMLNFVTCVAVSAITPAPPQAIRDMVQMVRMPDHPGPAVILDEATE